VALRRADILAREIGAGFDFSAGAFVCRFVFAFRAISSARS
jgi:hypothetical protein